MNFLWCVFLFSSRRRHTRSDRDWSSDVCSSDLEDQGEMEQQGRCEEACHDLRPIDFPVKSVKLSAVVEGPTDEGNQTKDIKVHGTRGIPPPNEDEKSDEQEQQAHDAQIVFRGERLFGRRGDEGSLKLFAVARKLVAHLRPEPGAIQTPRNFRSSCDMGAVDAEQNIVRVNSGASGG